MASITFLFNSLIALLLARLFPEDLNKSLIQVLIARLTVPAVPGRSGCYHLCLSVGQESATCGRDSGVAAGWGGRRWVNYDTVPDGLYAKDLKRDFTNTLYFYNRLL